MSKNSLSQGELRITNCAINWKSDAVVHLRRISNSVPFSAERGNAIYSTWNLLASLNNYPTAIYRTLKAIKKEQEKDKKIKKKQKEYIPTRVGSGFNSTSVVVIAGINKCEHTHCSNAN